MTTRRKLLKAVGGIVAAGVAVVAGGAGWMALKMREQPLGYALPEDAGSTVGTLPPTPDCADAEATEAQTQGPYYTPATPLRRNLREPGIPGAPLTLRGRVLRTDCRPVAGAVLDVWSCDGEGHYDNEGFRLRGHQFTDANGEFLLETVRPVAYSQFGMHRTPHLHIKVQGRDTQLLTTQLYFPGEPDNAGDAIFSAALLIDMRDEGEGHFDFVLTPSSA